MTSFIITGNSSLPRLLAGGESGVIGPGTASLIVASGRAVQMDNSASAGANSLTVNGMLVA